MNPVAESAVESIGVPRRRGAFERLRRTAAAGRPSATRGLRRLRSLRRAVPADARTAAPPVVAEQLGRKVSDLHKLRVAAPAAVRAIEEAHLEAFRYLRADHARFEELRLVTILRGIAKLPAAQQADELVALAAATTTRVEQMLDREARRRYAAGLLLGVGLTLLLLGGVYYVAIEVIALYRGGGGGLTTEEHYALRDVLVCVGGGAAGAVVSVLLRIGHAERLPPIGASQWRLLAFTRVALGWFFAAALLFAVKSGVVDVFAVPDTEGAADKVRSWFFWGIVGFLAGFNERWVKNLLSRDPDGGHPGKTGVAPASKDG